MCYYSSAHARTHARTHGTSALPCVGYILCEYQSLLCVGVLTVLLYSTTMHTFSATQVGFDEIRHVDADPTDAEKKTLLVHTMGRIHQFMAEDSESRDVWIKAINTSRGKSELTHPALKRQCIRTRCRMQPHEPMFLCSLTVCWRCAVLLT